MPLNREALTLEQTPSAVATARRWVTSACHELGRDDLVDCAALGVSELVTNAMLHGSPPLLVRVRGTTAHPRIEVHDASPHPPLVPQQAADALTPAETDLATYGRGLSMVAQASLAWGAAVEDNGKVVWFEPSTSLHEELTPGVVQSSPGHEWEPLADSMTVHLNGVPLGMFRSTLAQYSNLRRELRLLALAHDNDYPLARDLSPLFSTFERQFPPRTLAGLQADLQHKSDDIGVDLSFRASPRSTQVFRTMLEMFSLADAFCRSQHLLSLARTPAQKSLQEWMLDEFIAQQAGATPTPWPGSDEPAPSPSPARAHAGHA